MSKASDYSLPKGGKGLEMGRQCAGGARKGEGKRFGEKKKKSGNHGGREEFQKVTVLVGGIACYRLSRSGGKRRGWKRSRHKGVTTNWKKNPPRNEGEVK